MTHKDKDTDSKERCDIGLTCNHDSYVSNRWSNGEDNTMSFGPAMLDHPTEVSKEQKVSRTAPQAAADKVILIDRRVLLQGIPGNPFLGATDRANQAIVAAAAAAAARRQRRSASGASTPWT